jgi:hypothetical protein
MTMAKNVEIKTEGGIMTIKIDLNKTFGPSKSGKTIIIASTEGNVAVAKDAAGKEIKMGLNLYK